MIVALIEVLLMEYFVSDNLFHAVKGCEHVTNFVRWPRFLPSEASALPLSVSLRTESGVGLANLGNCAFGICVRWFTRTHWAQGDRSLSSNGLTISNQRHLPRNMPVS
jgi:hypothetical protein